MKKNRNVYDKPNLKKESYEAIEKITSSTLIDGGVGGNIGETGGEIFEDITGGK